MKICPKCKRQFDQNIAFCAFDGQQLSVSTSEDGLVGRLIDYKYQVHERIARGGTGSVYHGTHLQLNMPIAIKIMHSETACDLTTIERFRREAYAAMQIRHPNAIAVMDFGVTPDNLVYVVMEYLEGRTLRQRLKERRYLGLSEIHEIMQQICAAVAIAHKRKIIHRDLKPENIFLHTDGDSEVVKVLDFGIAKFKGIMGDEVGLELTRQGFVVGTPYYMSPEQCYGKEVDARSDIYSLGIMLYELLAGRLPFTGRSHTAVAVKQSREQPRPIYEVRPNVPAVLNAVVMHALEKKPDNRPADIAAFASELEAAMKAVTDKEFMKVFSEASEQDLEAAVLLTADPIRLSERTGSTRVRRKKRAPAAVEASGGEDLNMLTTSTTEMDEQMLTQSTEGLSISDEEVKAAEQQSAALNYQESFNQLARETSMLLQIILGDVDNNQQVDKVFLSELKGAVDQLRTIIYRLQQADS